MNVFEMLQNRMNDNEIIYVTCEEMEFIVFDIPQDRPPNPPIKYKREKESYGFFSGGRETTITVDHHAPEYLREMEEWRARQEVKMKNPCIRIMGPTKTYKIELESHNAEVSMSPIEVSLSLRDKD